MAQNTPRSLTQNSSMSAGDINQKNVLQSSVVTYRNDSQFSTNIIDGFSTGWQPISKATTSAVLQPFSVSGDTSVAAVRVPISVIGYNNVSAFTSFSSACDITVSVQNLNPTTLVPTGAVSSSSTIEVPAGVVQAVDANSFQEPQSALPGQFSSSVSAFANVPVTAITSTLSTAINTATATSIPVASSLPFYLVGGVGSASITGVNSTYSVSFTGISGNTLTGCTFTPDIFGQSEILPGGTGITSALPSSFAYVPAGSFLLAANMTPTTPTNNVVYAAPYIDGGTVGQWISGNPLPETPCSLAYSPSTGSIFAAAPSGAIYQASFDTAGLMGTWVAVENALSLPTFTKAPSICVATIDSVDYVFIIGGLRSSGSYSSVSYLVLDVNGNVSSVNSAPSLNFPVYLASGLQSFFANNTIYVRNSSSSNIVLFGLSLSIDPATQLLVTSSSWFTVNSSQNIGSIIYGQALSNIATDAGLTGLSPNGYGSSDFTNPFPAIFNSSSTGFTSPGFGAIFENNDGTGSAVFSAGFSNNIYQTTWLNVPISCALSSGVYYGVTVTASSPLLTNFGVNIGTVSNQVPFLPLAPYRTYSFSTSSWVPATNAIIPLGFYFTYTSTNTNTIPIGIIQDNGQSWTYFWYDSPNYLLTTVTDVTYDNSELTSSYSVLALAYDGIGGVVYQNETLMQPVLTGLTEVIYTV